jgi:RNA polymerase sigma-70 factor (ECF subfamily)
VKSNELLEDNTLIARIQNDDKDAFKALYKRYSGKLYNFSLRYFQNYKEEAEDLVQSIFIKIWINRKSIAGIKDFRSYIYTSAVNYIINYLRKKSIHGKYIENEILLSHLSSETTYDQVYLWDLEKSLDSVVESLPIMQQQVFRLSRIELLSHEEIAEKLGISLRTVENHIYRALKVIKKNLEKYN